MGRYGYEEIKSILNKMPVTFLGGSLAHIIKRCKKEKLFSEPEFIKEYIDRVIFNEERK